jgi:hypothetical protein
VSKCENDSQGGARGGKQICGFVDFVIGRFYDWADICFEYVVDK